jgi:hypothetical protein
MRFVLLVLLALAASVQSFAPKGSFLSHRSHVSHVESVSRLYKTGKIHEAIIAGDIPTAMQLMEEDPKAYKARDIEGMVSGSKFRCNAES